MAVDIVNPEQPDWLFKGEHIGRRVMLKRARDQSSDWHGVIKAYVFSAEKGRGKEAVLWLAENDKGEKLQLTRPEVKKGIENHDEDARAMRQKKKQKRI